MKAFVNSVPKSGTNLVHKALELFEYKYAKLGVADTLIRGRYPFIRHVIRNNIIDRNKIDVGLYSNTEVGGWWLSSRFKGLLEDSFITGHAAYSDKFKDLLVSNAVVPVIVVRDPRDVILSHVNYFPKRKDIYYGFPLTGNIDKDLLMVLHGGYGPTQSIRSFGDAYRAFLHWTSTYPNNVFKFEDLVGPRGGGIRMLQLDEIRRLSSMLGITLNESQVESLAIQLFGGTHTFSSGQIGGWKVSNEFKKIEREFMTQMEDVIEALGYSLE